MADSPTTDPQQETPAEVVHLTVLGACGCGSGCGCGCQSGAPCQCGGYLPGMYAAMNRTCEAVPSSLRPSGPPSIGYWL
ncbi:hypothetical protein AB0P40_42620, partial [Streptomyces sp. NPDC079189]|uniref:hypothetical protein n=1 Tax=Streptomyces sp. NPDC079189 TaxID=3154514 RepID=UPI003424852F